MHYCKSQLMINKWEDGIIWRLETKYSTKDGKYLDDAVVPLSFVIAQN